jgi:hypothetical protein
MVKMVQISIPFPFPFPFPFPMFDTGYLSKSQVRGWWVGSAATGRSSTCSRMVVIYISAELKGWSRINYSCTIYTIQW